MEKICVAVRLRPAVNEETPNGNGFHWKVENNRISLHKSRGTPISGVSFAFDHVLDQDCCNSRVYELLIKDIIRAAVEGFNGTAFAYGQTSSGKTFTMNGSENDPGIIHRAVKDIFAEIEMTTDREFLVRVSYMEIYNEDIIDLFAVENQKLQIHESLERGVFVAGLREEIVNSADQVLNLIQLGEVNRHFGETNMNARSSRSHTIFRMVIESKGKETSSSNSSSSHDAIRVSVLNLVDLAGSERIAKTGAGGVRLKEGKHINKSLMVLGNVINKLIEGAKQRGHIPYRDSKLTRILQPALGGNAKTSIICTVAPEEVHSEETKGTLQFASRAKRITNCVQVNEILTDAALLKRQKLEIEELRLKLQGSRSEVLEQEILKLRNDMLKYELEREKLAMELEEERRSHKERDQCIREQQIKIDNLSNQSGVKGSLGGESNDSHSICQEDAFSTPCLKTAPNAFVFKRSQYSRQPDCSPLPDTCNDFADEDTWMKMNKGYIADLDALNMTPARKAQSFPSVEDFSAENCNQEMLNIRRQLQIVTEERDELKMKHMEQVMLNNQLTQEMSELQQEALLIQEVPRALLESVTNCKDVYKDILSVLENFVADEKSATAEILSTTSEVGLRLFSTLEAHFSMSMDGHQSHVNNNSIQEHCNMLRKRLNSTISSLVLSDTPTIKYEHLEDFQYSSKRKGTLGEEIASWKREVDDEVKTIKQKYQNLESELVVNNKILEVSENKYHSLEREFQLLKAERDVLLERVSNSSQVLAQVTDQKEKVLQDFNAEVQRRTKLEEEIKQFSVAFASRQRSVMSFQSDFKSVLENLKAQNPVSALVSGKMEEMKIFVGGISWETTDEILKQHFAKYGTVVGSEIVKDRNSGSPRGFAFVEVKKAIPRSEQQQNRQQHDRGWSWNSRTYCRINDKVSSKKIFVGGLSADLTKEEFQRYFEKFGRTTDVVVMYDNVTHRPRGFGFITFDSEDCVEEVMQKNFHELSGKLVEVKRAVPKDEISSNSDGYGRLGGGREFNFNYYQQGSFVPYNATFGYLPSEYGSLAGYPYGAGIYGGGYGEIGYGLTPVAPWSIPAMVGGRGCFFPYGSAAPVNPTYFTGGAEVMSMSANGYYGILGSGLDEKSIQPSS
ncbi:P-loop containing nucleoside triphosphate hydrolase superfamily protein [Abeliophyllum distichum]|uniref:P-loop containing nucleoside triphosphate hydrolase superfamily protein n=1 Tax=Abeliophyllum distichum TaxID=126358 RepID=A0ABD1NS17_9LAMI